MALVESQPLSRHLHGTVELIEDKSQTNQACRTKGREDELDALNSQLLGLDLETTKQIKKEIVMVTVKPLTPPEGSRKSSFTSGKSSEDTTTEKITEPRTLDVDDDKPPAMDRKAARRYSLMMANLAATRVEECKANLRRNSTAASPGALTGMSGESARGGSWDWRVRGGLDDFYVREKYFADEL